MKLKEMMLCLPQLYVNGTIFCINSRRQGREDWNEKQEVAGLSLDDWKNGGKI